jgi:hypothetical protein
MFRNLDLMIVNVRERSTMIGARTITDRARQLPLAPMPAVTPARPL